MLHCNRPGELHLSDNYHAKNTASYKYDNLTPFIPVEGAMSLWLVPWTLDPAVQV